MGGENFQTGYRMFVSKLGMDYVQVWSKIVDVATFYRSMKVDFASKRVFMHGSTSVTAAMVPGSTADDNVLTVLNSDGSIFYIAATSYPTFSDLAS